MNRFYVFFVITLILTLPVHHAHALSVKVSGNHGNAGVDGYLNGNGDVWELTTTLTNLEYPPTPDQVFLEIGTASTPFTSCSGDGTSAECKFISDLSDGISAGSYSFQVAVYDVETAGNETVLLDEVLGSDTENVYVDAQAPTVTFLDARQESQDVKLDFVAYDSGTCSGLKLLEVYDNSDGTVLDSITFDEPGTCEYDYETGNRAGVLPADLGDQGDTELRVRATDWMGIQGVSNVVYFTRDFVDPIADSISFPGTTSIGNREIFVDTMVNITECSGLTEVLLVSEQINYKSIPGDIEYQGDCHYEVTWDGYGDAISFTPTGESVTVTVVMQDQYDNIAEDVLSYNFDRDITPPEVTFFGTEYLFNDVSYMADDVSTNIVATIEESGSGLEPEYVIASFKALDSLDYVSADYCLNESSVYTCVWEDIKAGGEGTRTEDIRLIQVMDNAGNDYGSYTAPLVIDSVGPSVLDMEIIAMSEYGEFQSFKSGDDVLIKMEVSETSGLVAKLGVHDLVMDAETKYDYGTDPYDDEREHEDNGYAIFTDESCQRNDDGYWDCEFIIENIRTGPVTGADLDILLYDTARNFAEVWNYSLDGNHVQCNEGSCEINILAADYDTVPDLWEQGSTESESYVLLDISDATYPRQDFTVTLHSDGARLENQILQSCVGPDNAPLVNRPVLLGGLGEETPRMTLVMELQPFDSSLVVPQDSVEFTESVIEYNCTVLLFSSRNRVTYTTPEEQVLVVPVSFGFSQYGALEEQVPALIEELTDSGSFKFLETMNKVAEGLKIAQRVLDIGKVVGNILEIIGFFKTAVTVAGCTADKVKGDMTCMSGTSVCAAIDAGTVPASKLFQGINAFTGILFCEAQPITVDFGELAEALSLTKGTQRELNRLTAAPTETSSGDTPGAPAGDAPAGDAPADDAPAAPPVSRPDADATADATKNAAAPNDDNSAKAQESGGATYYSFVAAVRAYHTTIVTVWSILRGQFLVNAFTNVFTGGAEADLEQRVGTEKVNRMQSETFAIEQQIRGIEDNKERERVYTQYQEWAKLPVSSETQFDLERAQARYYTGEAFQGTLQTEMERYSDVDNGETKAGSAQAIAQSLIKIEARNSWSQLLQNGVRASLYDNFWISAVSVCLPGIVYNLQKLYLIECSYLHCLKNDVPSGLATIDTCTQTRDYLTCKFWYGEMVGQIMGMFGNIAEGITDLLISFVTDPISLLMFAATLICGQTGCQNARIDSGGMITACTIYQVVGMASEVGNYVSEWVEFSSQNSKPFASCLEVEESLSETVEGDTEVTEVSETTETTGTTTVSEQ